MSRLWLLLGVAAAGLGFWGGCSVITGFGEFVVTDGDGDVDSDVDGDGDGDGDADPAVDVELSVYGCQPDEGASCRCEPAGEGELLCSPVMEWPETVGRPVLPGAEKRWEFCPQGLPQSFRVGCEIPIPNGRSCSNSGGFECAVTCGTTGGWSSDE